MEKNEFKDRLFGVLNDTDNLPIQDLMVDDRNDKCLPYRWHKIFRSCRKIWDLERL